MGTTKFMDVTLRDGSYAIDFQFSCSDERRIVSQLSMLGFEYIEVGHGLGLGASSLKNGIALHSDEEYLSAAMESANGAKYGMFCIPGIARVEHIRLLKEYGGSFVRIGTNIDSVAESEPYIYEARKQGLTVMANYMKSYTSTGEDFALQALLSQKFGAEVVYIVDSAGGMFPEDIDQYIDAVRSKTDIMLGFHAHDNLGLAVSNSLHAYKRGVDFIDCSLQGMGRSAGNASSELLFACLEKKFGLTDWNTDEICLAGKELISPIYRRSSIAPIDVVCGVADFHSSYLKSIHKISAKYDVNPLELIRLYSKVDQINMNENMLDNIARSMPKSKMDSRIFDFRKYFGNEQKKDPNV